MHSEYLKLQDIEPVESKHSIFPFDIDGDWKQTINKQQNLDTLKLWQETFMAFDLQITLYEGLDNDSFLFAGDNLITNENMNGDKAVDSWLNYIFPRSLSIGGKTFIFNHKDKKGENILIKVAVYKDDSSPKKRLVIEKSEDVSEQVTKKIIEKVYDYLFKQLKAIDEIKKALEARIAEITAKSTKE